MNPDLPQLAARLVDILGQEVKWLDMMRTLLLAERDNLSGRSPETLGKLATEKNTVLAELANCETHRADLMTQLSVSNAVAADWPNELSSLPTAMRSTIGQLWTSILQNTQVVRELNQQNGQTIELSMRHVRGALEVLCSGAPSLYNTSGHSERPAPSRTLGSA